MPCTSRRIDVQEQVKRISAIEKLEKALAAGQTSVVVDIFGKVTIRGGVKPEWMMDGCVLAMLQTRNSLAWQMIVAQNQKLQGKNFVEIHNASHAAGEKH